MTDQDRPRDDQSGQPITRREAVASSVAAGLVAMGSPLPREHPEPAQEQTIPRTNRGYFVSKGGRFIPRGQGFDATTAEFYEAPLEDPNYLEVFTYTDKISYLPGEEVRFHTSTTAKTFSIEIVRDGAAPQTVHRVDSLAGSIHPLRSDFYERGCGWPVSHSWRLPAGLRSGFYMVISRARNDAGELREQEHGFFVLPADSTKHADTLFISATCTWTAYNDWGGISNYVGYNLPEEFTFAPRLTIQRPFSRGIIWSPEGSPRKPHHFKIAPNSIPVYPVIEFAYTRGYSKWFSNCGWATYERPFVVWAERNGFGLDYATQIDLHYRPNLLDGYKCVVLVGHDEYWSWEMREAIDRYVERGGNVARFAGNFAWQIRLEDEGRTQVCYKGLAGRKDPVRNTDRRRRLTSLWEDPAVNWWGAETFGLNATYGVYAHVGVNVPRGTGGFTVYRPEHWAFAGTDLYYGDDFGGEARIFGYEVDGLDYTFRDGVPYPTFRDHAPQSTEILAMALASNTEADHGHKGTVFYYGDGSAGIAETRYGKVTEETKKAGARANGMIVTFTRGKGTVFHAGSCEWVAGLKLNDFYTETITRNVLKRFTAG